MAKSIVNTHRAPAPVGPYNQATLHNGVLYVSGQIALDPDTGELVQTDIEAETHRVMKNLEAVLHKAGLSFLDVLKCTIFVKDMGMYGRINAVYAEYFETESAPARELVEVSALPKYVNIEISLLAAMS